VGAVGKESINVTISLLSMASASPRSLLAASMRLREGLGLRYGNRAVGGLWLPGAPHEKARIGPIVNPGVVSPDSTS